MCCLFPDAIKLTLSILPLYKHRVIEISDDKRPVMVLFFFNDEFCKYKNVQLWPPLCRAYSLSLRN